MKLAPQLRRWIESLDREAWIRFFIALGGLVIAFSSAMLSTAFRDEGNVVATAITASLALITAGVVGVATVPYLAKGVARDRARIAMQYELTREGSIYLIGCIVIAVAALNTGNNLLFIVVAAMLAAVLVSGVFSTLTLLCLELDVRVPEHIFAGQKVMGGIAIRNHSRFSAFSVSIVAVKQKRRGRQKRDAVATLLQSTPYFPLLSARQAGFQNVTLHFDRRGRYLQKQFGISTRFPFSFLKKTRVVELERELIVLPSIEPTEEFLETLPLIAGEFEAFVQGRGHDLYRIRDYAPGDAARHIDWKASAKEGIMMVREFTREDERSLRIIFDNPPLNALREDVYEKGVALAASLAWYFANQHAQLSFMAPGYKGPDQVLSFLKYLALVKPGDETFSFAQMAMANAYNLVLTSKAAGSIPSDLWATSYFIFLGKQEPHN